MDDTASMCAACGEPARLVCSGCQRIFCVEHLERHFAMGYFYFCAECLARQAAAEQGKRSGRKRNRAPDA